MKHNIKKLSMLKNIDRRKVIILLIGIISGFIVGFTVKSISARVDSNRLEEEYNLKEDSLKLEVKKLEKELSDKYRNPIEVVTPTEDNWKLILVNDTHLLNKEYVPELTEVANGKSVDSRIADNVTRMLNDAEQAGMNLYVISAYRSYEEQRLVFDDSMKDRFNSGMTYLESYEDTALSVAVPGQSEHALGLALDIVSADYLGLDEAQADTKEAKWLEENCYKYGFILRYPTDKQDITKILYEPWHYRYVGEDVAEEIMSSHVTLEEYLGK